MLADIPTAELTEKQRAELANWRAFYRQIEREYKIGEASYVKLYVAQSGVCFICRKARGRDPRDPLAYAGRERKPRRLGVDHHHFTGEVRGLLCTGSVSANTCNRLIARYTPEALERAAAYLRNPPARDVL